MSSPIKGQGQRAMDLSLNIPHAPQIPTPYIHSPGEGKGRASLTLTFKFNLHATPRHDTTRPQTDSQCMYSVCMSVHQRVTSMILHVYTN